MITINNSGIVNPSDALGIVFLQNPTKLNSAKEDRELAKKVVEKAGSNSDYTKMNKALQELQTAKTTTK